MAMEKHRNRKQDSFLHCMEAWQYRLVSSWLWRSEVHLKSRTRHDLFLVIETSRATTMEFHNDVR